MNNFYNELYKKINKYKNRSGSRVFAIRLAGWCFRNFVSFPNLPKKAVKKRIKVAVQLTGGVGDILAQSTYLMALIKYLGQEDVEFDLFACRDKSLLDSLFYNANYVKHRYTWKESEKLTKQYDLILVINRFVSISQINWKTLDMNSPKLFEFCKKIHDFYEKNQFLFNHPPLCDYLSINLALLNDKNRLTHADILDLINIPDEPNYFMDLKSENFSVLQQWELDDSPYITLQRGLNHNDNKQDATRNWPLSHYNDLVKLIHQDYPDIKIVQLGYSVKNCKEITGVDLDLRGKTSFDELKVLLKHSLLHIDSEGGYAHIRHFLGGKSVILFGPTPLNYYGYKNNINIRCDACQSPCEWLTSTWLDKCCRGFDSAPCMAGIKAPDVFNEVKKYFSILSDYNYDISFKQSLDFNHVPSNLGKVALFNIGQNELPIIDPNHLNIFSTMPSKELNVILSGTYNIPAQSNYFSTIYAFIDPNESCPGFVLQELLRVLQCDGQLLLKINKVFTSEQLLPLELELPELKNTGVIKIVKHRKSNKF